MGPSMLPQCPDGSKVRLNRLRSLLARKPFAHDDDAAGAVDDVPDLPRAQELGLRLCAAATGQFEQLGVGQEHGCTASLFRSLGRPMCSILRRLFPGDNPRPIYARTPHD